MNNIGPRIGIDLHNIRNGGGVNYINNILAIADPSVHNFSSLCLFGAPNVLETLRKTPFIEHCPIEELRHSLPRRIAYVTLQLPRELRRRNCDVLYAPGGVVSGDFKPYVTISRNMLPFSPKIWTLYPFGMDKLRLYLLNRVNRKTYSNAHAMIYLTKTARDTIEPLLVKKNRPAHIIPHGVNHHLFSPPNHTIRDRPFDPAGDIHLVCPSRLEPYKHQLEVIEAVTELRQQYPNIRMTLLGWANPSYEAQVHEAIAHHDPDGVIFNYRGAVPNSELSSIYEQSHLMVFASSCENMPNTLIEGMASGLPVISSAVEPMLEVGGDACLYFDPTDPCSIAFTLTAALTDYRQTLRRAQVGLKRAKKYNWERCAEATFSVLRHALEPEFYSVLETE